MIKEFKKEVAVLAISTLLSGLANAADKPVVMDKGLVLFR